MCSESTLPVSNWIDDQLESLIGLYSHFHSHPELSCQETETANRLAREWRDAGAEVTTDVGGHGVVGLMANGPGPTLMLRTDMDALPVTEQTGLPYASRVIATDHNGNQTGVMHACGHDVHMTNLAGVARYLSTHRTDWSGTVMLVGQPAEETGTGAAMMLQDGLFERFPKPDFALALHIAHDIEVGHVAWWSGAATANVDTVDITLFGKGGHGSRPHSTIDPIVQAAHLVLSLQDIVSREISSAESAVLTVGSIHGGSQHNIIDDHCQLQLTVRSHSDTVRRQLRDGIVRRSRAVAMGAGAHEPDVQFTSGTPSVHVDQQLAARVATTLERLLGADRVTRAEALMVGEDYGRYGQAGIPLVMYRLGTVNAQHLRQSHSDGTPLPSLHSPRYAPDIALTLKTGILTMAGSALELLGTPSTA